MRKVEIDHRIFAAANFQLVRDGARYYIAWGKLRERMVFGHETCHLLVAENRAFAAKGFGQKKFDKYGLELLAILAAEE